MKILVADDDTDAVETLQMALESNGHEIVTAFTGVDAIQQARTEKPDAAILDVSMPGMMGTDVAAAIRREEWGEDMLLIALTGWNSPEDLMASDWAGFDKHVSKPASIESLERTLRSSE
jgi:CheY-like chemotaxis protein